MVVERFFTQRSWYYWPQFLLSKAVSLTLCSDSVSVRVGTDFWKQSWPNTKVTFFKFSSRYHFSVGTQWKGVRYEWKVVLVVWFMGVPEGVWHSTTLEKPLMAEGKIQYSWHGWVRDIYWVSLIITCFTTSVIRKHLLLPPFPLTSPFLVLTYYK